MANNKIHFIDCNCRSEVLRIEDITDDDVWEDYVTITGTGQFVQGTTTVSTKPSAPICITLAIYRQRIRTIWDRLRVCWHTLFYGEPYGDDMVLDIDGINRLKEVLENVTTE